MEWLHLLWNLARRPGSNRIARVRAFHRIASLAKAGDPTTLAWLDGLAERRGWKQLQLFASLR